ncbi:AcrR family transcriptional regulator [Kibdelosporangium banguiense]|uniref:AcrR family transcriptional regulator n=1 Tax=Kibdelosporangium banguiense TaxID=1365924 RepID=A0ABS4U0G6_9PSEU|nr:TetR/AcrR family transcriptional regulator [Kibdelosporangium banguiense]MBP2330126.1 AcrR family transcriptional regulator [Kibdelosporangium banguiense]
MSRTADPSAQQAQLSQAVWDVLAGQGLERLTIRAVAAAAGCTTGLVMHRFPNRRALLRHARQLLHERTRDRVETLETESASPQTALRAVLAQALALDAETTAEAIVWVGFLASAVGDDELTTLHQANNQAWRERIIRLVSAVAPRWPKDRVATTAYALIAMVEGTAALASTDPAAYPPTTQLAMLDTTLTAFALS